MIEEKLQAIALSWQKHGEHDAFLTLFSLERGKIKALARGVYKMNSKLRASLLPFRETSVDLIKTRSGFRITGAYSQDRQVIFRNPQNIERAAKVARIVDQFVPGEVSDESLFILIKTTFRALKAECSADLAKKIFVEFLSEFITQAGFELPFQIKDQPLKSRKLSELEGQLEVYLKEHLLR